LNNIATRDPYDECSPWAAVVIGSAIDWADINAQLDASLALEDLAPSLDGLPDSPEPFLLWHKAEQAAWSAILGQCRCAVHASSGMTPFVNVM
jgi:hypothetical protein